MNLFLKKNNQTTTKLPRRVGILLVLIFSFFSLNTIGTIFAEMDAMITLEPENPSPKSSVVLTLSSYSFDVNTAMITWKIGSKIILRGQGEKSVSIKTGNVGTATDVHVLAETADGSSIEQIINVTPSSVLLLYESYNSYLPPLYEGRSLPSDGGLIRVTAFPQISDKGVPVPASQLSYTWYIDDTIIQSASGAGKQTALIRLDFLQSSDDIKVLIRSPYGNTTTKTITIYPHPVMPLLYKYDQVLGPDFTTLVDKRFEAVHDFTLALEPFYVSQREGMSSKDPSYTWFLDGLPTTPIGGRLLSMHPKEDSYGAKILRIVVTGPDTRIQKEETETELIFDTRK